MAVLAHLLAGDGAALSNNDTGKLVRIKKTIDFSKVNAAVNDVVKLFNIPADVLIQDVVANVKTAEGGTLTFDIGDYLKATDAAVDADGYIDGANGNTVAASKTSGGATAYASGKAYIADTAYLGLEVKNAADAAVIEVTVLAVAL